MNARHLFTGVVLLIISLITTSMIVPAHMAPLPQLTLQELLFKRAFIYRDNAQLEVTGQRKLTILEKMVFKKIRKQFRKDLQKQHLLGNCDTVVMQDGSKFKAIVTEVRPSEIFYKMCDDPEGATFSIKTSALSHIQYANGSRVDYQSKEASTPSLKKTNDTDPLAIAALATGLGSFLSLFVSSFIGGLGLIGFFGLIAAFVLGLMSLRNIKRSKGKLKGRGMAIAGLIIGIVGILLFALAILLIVLVVSSIP